MLIVLDFNNFISLFLGDILFCLFIKLYCLMFMFLSWFFVGGEFWFRFNWLGLGFFCFRLFVSLLDIDFVCWGGLNLFLGILILLIKFCCLWFCVFVFIILLVLLNLLSVIEFVWDWKYDSCFLWIFFSFFLVLIGFWKMIIIKNNVCV